jgi:hypothetical protein
MWTQILGVCSLLALGSASAFGAGIDGKWIADPNDTIKSMVFVFKVADGVLTGTATPGAQPPAAIQNGKIEGDHISFEVVRTVLMTKVVTKYTGTVAGDVINLRGSNLRGSLDLVLRKSAGEEK